jgi:hypothetical protein
MDWFTAPGRQLRQLYLRSIISSLSHLWSLESGHSGSSSIVIKARPLPTSNLSPFVTPILARCLHGIPHLRRATYSTSCLRKVLLSAFVAGAILRPRTRSTTRAGVVHCVHYRAVCTARLLTSYSEASPWSTSTGETQACYWATQLVSDAPLQRGRNTGVRRDP